MNTRIIRFGGTCILLGVLSCIPAIGQTDPEVALPSINLSNTPLTDVIGNLAHQSGQNYILDPSVTNKPVTVHWENITAGQALSRLAHEQGLQLIYSSSTCVYRIALTNLAITPVSSDQLFGDTNSILELVSMDSMPLDVVISSLARQAKVEIEIDPKVTQPTRNAAGLSVRPPMVSIRWRKLSAAQALAAVLDNYDLQATKDAASGKLKISPRPITSPPAIGLKPKSKPQTNWRMPYQRLTNTSQESASGLPPSSSARVSYRS